MEWYCAGLRWYRSPTRILGPICLTGGIPGENRKRFYTPDITEMEKIVNLYVYWQ
jgi:hypothetical protein